MRPESAEPPNRGPNESAQCAKHKFPIVHKQSNQASKLATSQAITPPSWRIPAEIVRGACGIEVSAAIGNGVSPVALEEDGAFAWGHGVYL